ncbi:MAG: DUF5123 domain-containing protein [Candidatus Cryptobacteroides sp.]
MKLYNKILAFTAAVLAIGSAASCSNPLEEIDNVILSRCLQPMNLSAKISQGQNVTFGWDVAKDAETYTLEIYNDEAMSQLELSESLELDQIPFTVTLDVDKSYWFRVQAHSPLRDDSKWADYGKAIKTYAVKPNLYMELAGRDATSISLTWKADPEVDRIEYGAPGAEEMTVRQLTADEIAAGKATVTGLAPSTEYDLILYFSSANRGEVVAWTMPDPSGLVAVSTSEALAQQIKDGANILLKMEGSPYSVSSDADIAKGLDLPMGFKIYGEGSADGSLPVINGCFNIIDTFDGKDIYIEGVSLNGIENKCGFVIQHKEGSTTDGVKVASIVFRNCEMSFYSKGLFYEWGKTLEIGTFGFESCYIHDINADGSGGGDGIDIRQATKIDNFDIVNNTITNGFRTFLRIDANPVIGNLRFENNTLMNLCFVDNTNNGGIIGIQAAPASMTLKKNLFLNMGEKATLTRDNAKYLDGENLNLTAADNWFFNVPETFFTRFTLSQASGKTLSEDPCFNSKAGKFNILGTSDIAGQGIGASKWWVEYVEAPEDLTMTTITGNHTWDFNNAVYFSSDFTKTKVRDYLYFGVTDNKITLVDGVLGFTAAAVTTRKGVPTDGYLAFQVSEPGSLLIKPVDEAGKGNHFVVGVGPLSGTSISVKGGASALADMNKAQKILFKDITEESLVYIYPSGPISLEQLAWSTDLSEVNTALPTPEPKATPDKITSGNATEIVVTWEPVANAGSYSIVFNGQTYDADETQEGEQPRFTVPSTMVGMLDPGSYKVNVYANPAKDDIYNTMSEAGVAVFSVQSSGGSEGPQAFSVTSVDELTAALGAQKAEIMLMESGSPYTLPDNLSLNYPVVITGESKNVIVKGVFTFEAGEISGDITISNLTFDDSAAGKGNFVTFPDAFQMGNLTLENLDLIGFNKSLIYANYAGTVTKAITVKGVMTSEWGTGQGVIDFRKGSFESLKITESTFTGGRDFIRMDSAVTCPVVNINKNTFDGLNVTANGNGVIYVRNTPMDFTLNDNLWLNEIAEGKNVIFAKSSGVTVPSMSNNFYWNIDQTNFFSGMITREIGTAGNGVELTGNSPVKDAVNGDYTLTNSLAISCRVGDPRWNPYTDNGSSASSFTAKTADELTAAILAGKTNIILEAGEYVLTDPLGVTADLRLTGNGDVIFKGKVTLGAVEGGLGNLMFENIKFNGENSLDVAINVTESTTANSIVIKNCDFVGYTKSVYYDNGKMSQAGSLIIYNCQVYEQGTGQGVFDVRSGAKYGQFLIEQCTIQGGRDLVRADASTVTGTFSFCNNTVDGANLGANGNGVMYVRATPENYLFRNNLFLNEIAEGKTVILSKATGVTVPTQASANYFYNISDTFLSGSLINQEACAGTVLTNNPVTDSASRNYTLTNFDLTREMVGAARWIPGATVPVLRVRR